jgi:nucleoside-diphosphate-sugar epimerase
MIKILITGGNGNIAKMIKNHLENEYEITAPNRQELNLLNFEMIRNYFEKKEFDILVHTAIEGGRRTKEENYSVVYNNLLMFENIMQFADKFKMIINMDSAAIYDRSTDICNRKEYEIKTIPTDFYGFSKYLIYKRGMQYDHFFNLRIFNIFHENEENDRFIKSCFIAKKENKEVHIFEDKYFDFFNSDDFVKVVKYYFDNLFKKENLYKTVNVCYKDKYKLSEIAKMILDDQDKIKIDGVSEKNYCGDSELLMTYGIEISCIEYIKRLYCLNEKKM